MKEIQIDYNGQIYDVELKKNHTLIVRRKGKVCVSGNCRCELIYIPKGYIWSEEENAFIPPKDFQRTVERRSKVRIQIGYKNFEI